MNVYEEISELKKDALARGIPIMQDAGIDFLTSFLDTNQVSSVLEIGTAVGYSAIMMALSRPNLTITSVERDHERYLEAVKNIKRFGLEDRVTLIFQDALDIFVEEKYDLVFLDAAKGQNIRFFEKFSKNLNPNGAIITDNMDFHGLVQENEENIESKNLRSLIRKLKMYISYLEDHPNFSTTFYHIGDGISVSRKKLD